MKRILTFLALCIVMCLHSCYDDAALWQTVNDHSTRLTQLETLCNQMNSDISSLKTLVTAIQNGGYITSVTPLVENRVEVGYMLTLSNGKTVSVYHGSQGDKGDKGNKGDQGDEGSTPNIAVKQDTDGKYYWTVDGEWLLDDKESKVQVAPEEAEDGVTPLVRIENGIWQVSYDNGTSWNDLGSAEPENPCIFKDVKYEKGILTLYFSDETMLPLSVGSAFQIVLGEYVLKGISYEVPYTIIGAIGDVEVFCLALAEFEQECWAMQVIKESAYTGKIKVDSWWDDAEYNGRAVLFALDENGTTISKTLKWTTGVFEPMFEDEYYFGPESSQFEIKFASNREWDVEVDADWLTYIKTKAVEEKTFAFAVQENTGSYRTSNIRFTSGDKIVDIPVSQKYGLNFNAVFRVDKSTNLITDATSFYIYFDSSDQQCILNSEGKTLYEVLGYTSWDEFAYAYGDINNPSGDIMFSLYDLKTNISYGEDVIPTGGYLYITPEGKPRYDDGNYFAKMRWNSSYNLLSSRLYLAIDPSFECKTYSFGIVLSTPTAEARIEFNINIVPYVDPEAGMYNNPLPSGEYEFDIKDDLEIAIPYDAEARYKNESVYKIIKQTIGMTSYELYNNMSSSQSYFLLPDDSNSYKIIRLDSDANKVASYTEAAVFIHSFGLSRVYTDEFLIYRVFGVLNPDGSTYSWSQQVLEALEKGTVYKYKFVFEYTGKDQIGTYSFVFNIEAKFKKKETTL